MKRQLKFRAWEDYGEGHRSMIYDRGDLSEFFDATKGDDIMQFTGLLDKNGKEIWEGDIVKLVDTDSKYDDEMFTVSFRMGSFEMQQDESTAPLSFIYLAVQLRNKGMINRDYNALHFIEVVGNIYENPELL